MSEQKFEKSQLILIRLDKNCTWNIHQYFRDSDQHIFVLGGAYRKDSIECVPYEENEHLLGTTDNPKPKWQPKIGEAVLVRNDDRESWQIRLFVNMYQGKYSATLFEELNSRTLWKYCKPYNPNAE